MCEKGEVTSVEEGHDVERASPLREEFGVRSDVTKDTMPVMVKLAQEIDESHGIGQPTAECQLKWPSRRKAGYMESLFVQGGAKGTVKRVLALMAWLSREGRLHRAR